MKKILLFITAIFICGAAIAQTIRWHIGDTVYQTTTCNAGESITPPTAPDKFGYSFVKWKLPYTPIEYLESTGTQYIDTGVKQSDFVQNLIIDVVFKFVSTKNGVQMLFGASSGNGFFNFYATQSDFYMQSGPGQTESSITQFDTNKHTMIVNSVQQSVIIDGNAYHYRTNTANITANIYLLSRNREYFASARIYSISFLTANNHIIRDFIPVLDKDGTPCMYDKVEKKFYYNAGTGQFIAGPVLTE